jgi:hypothetical protein
MIISKEYKNFMNFFFCNENQLGALFILNLYNHTTCTYFGSVIAHHQMVFTVYVQQLVLVICLGVWHPADNLVHCLSLIYFVSQLLHNSGVFITHHQEVFTVCVQQLVCVGHI